MATIGQLAVKLTVSAGSAIGTLKNAAVATAELGSTAASAVTGVRSLGGEVEKAQVKISGLADSAKSAIATFLGFASLGGGIGLGVKLAADAEQAEVAFTTMLGSAERAREMMADLTQFAAETPFELPGLVAAGKSLVAFGTEQSQVIPELRMLGDIASGIGAPLDELAQLYGKARIQGRLFAEDVNQLTGRGIPVIQEFAKQFGVTESEVRELVKEGKIGFEHLQQALVNMTTQGGMFAGGMADQSKTLAGLFSTLKDGASGLFREFGQGFIATANLKQGVENITAGFTSMHGIARTVGSVLGRVAGWFLSLGRVIAPVYVGLKIAAIAFALVAKSLLTIAAFKLSAWLLSWLGITPAILLVRAAMFTLVMAYKAISIAATIYNSLAGPAGWAKIAAAIAVAGIAVYATKRAFDAVSGSAAASSKEAEELKTQAESMGVAIEDSGAAAAASMNTYKESLKEAREAINEVSVDARRAGMDEYQKKMHAFKYSIYEANDAAGIGGVTEEQKHAMRQYQYALDELKVAEQKAKIAKELKDLEKESAQASMTRGQRMLDDLRRAGASAKEIAAAQKQANEIDRIQKEKDDAREKKRKDAERERLVSEAQRTIAGISPKDKLEAEYRDIKRLYAAGAIDKRNAIRAGLAATQEYREALATDFKKTAGGSLASPAALMKGSAEADLARDREMSQANLLTNLQKQELDVARKQEQLLKQMLAEIQNNNEQTVGIP